MIPRPDVCPSAVGEVDLEGVFFQGRIADAPSILQDASERHLPEMGKAYVAKNVGPKLAVR